MKDKFIFKLQGSNLELIEDGMLVEIKSIHSPITNSKKQFHLLSPNHNLW